MRESMQTYRQALIEHRADPVRRWDGRSTGKLLDSSDPAVPLLLLDLDGFALSETPVEFATGQREWLIVPIEGVWRARIAPAGGAAVEWTGARRGGPFAAWPSGCNAQAVYAPRQATVSLSGAGEAIGFSAPAFADKPPAFVRHDPAHPLVPRGSGVWRRDVVTLATPDDLTSNLVFGETYSPPGLWSGTPLHVHDGGGDSPDQSDHEEIYYHLARRTPREPGRLDPGAPREPGRLDPIAPREPGRLDPGEPGRPGPGLGPGPGPGDCRAGGPAGSPSRWEPYAVQLLFDDHGLDQAYPVHDRTAFAIPGGAHPVVAGPNGEMMYVWCLAGRTPQPLAMLDVAEFAWLKRVGGIIDALRVRHAAPINRQEIGRLADDAGLTPDQARVLAFHLAQLGLDVTE